MAEDLNISKKSKMRCAEGHAYEHNRIMSHANDCIAWLYRRAGAFIHGGVKIYPVRRLWEEVQLFWHKECESLLELLVQRVLEEVDKQVRS